MYLSSPTITTIGEGTFSHCVKLMGVRLPPNLKVIPPRAFFMCHEMQTVNLESTMVSRIRESAFESCIKLSEIGIPSSSLEEIADYAFLGCASLKVWVNTTQSLQLLKSIGQGAFQGCKSLLGKLDLSLTKLEEIQADAFKECSSLQQLRLNAESLSEIESNAFTGCSSLEQVTFHPSGNLKSIGPSAFQECVVLQSLDFPASLESIDCEAFESCWHLASLRFRQGLSHIAEDAFSGCQLRDVTIPSSVDYLMEDAFDDYYFDRIDVDGDRLELSTYSTFANVSRCLHWNVGGEMVLLVLSQ